jgi:hypothetical protein
MLRKIKSISYILFLCIYWIISSLVILSFIGGFVKGINPQNGRDIESLVNSIGATILSIPTYFLLKFLNKKTRLPIPVIVTIFMVLAISFFG